jgi:hypothetical protein
MRLPEQFPGDDKFWRELVSVINGGLSIADNFGSGIYAMKFEGHPKVVNLNHACTGWIMIHTDRPTQLSGELKDNGVVLRSTDPNAFVKVFVF